MLNKTEIIGYLGKDPEMRYSPNGKAVTSFSVAVGRKYTNSDGQVVDETTWFRCSAWGKLAEVCKNYLAKGKQVFIEGMLICDKQTGGPRIFIRQDGSTGTSFELLVRYVEFLGSKVENHQEQETSEEIPF